MPAPAFIGQGGTIPLMGLLGGLFPDAQFLACGGRGPTPTDRTNHSTFPLPSD